MFERQLALIHHRAFPLGLFLLALTVRLLLLGATFPGNANVLYYEDVTIATSLVGGGGYAMAYSGLNVTNEFFGSPPEISVHDVGSRPTAIKPPVYPIIVSLVFWLFGLQNFLALFLVHAVLAALTCALLFLVARNIGPWVAALSGVIFALYPPFAYHSIRTPESTTLLLFLICLFLFLILQYRNARSTGLLVASAAVGATIALTEAVAIPLIGAAFVYTCLLPSQSLPKVDAQSLKRGFKHIGLAFGLAVLALSPWLYRNYQVFDNFPMLRTGMGTNLLMTLRRAEVLPDRLVISIANKVPGTNELEEERIIEDEVKGWIEANSTAYLLSMPRNFVEYWWETAQYRGNDTLTYLLGRKVPYIILLLVSLPAMLWSCIQLLARPAASLKFNALTNLGLFLVISYTGVYTLFGAHNIRYHFPVELMMMIFGAQTLSYLIKRIPVRT